jgi:hypothetical protein
MSDSSTTSPRDPRASQSIVQRGLEVVLREGQTMDQEDARNTDRTSKEEEIVVFGGAERDVSDENEQCVTI